MSKVTEKEKQGFQEECPRCGNCSDFKSNFVKTKWGYNQEKNLRCGIGGFKVKKMNYCSNYTRKD